jgi:hypothetical protein
MLAGPHLGGRRGRAAFGLGAFGQDGIERLAIRQHSEPSADSPETTRALVELPDVRPLMLRGRSYSAKRDVPALVEDVLEAQREAPIVQVSEDNSTSEPASTPWPPPASAPRP